MPQQPVELILLRQLASYLTVPVFLAGEDENLLYYNEAAEALLGREFEEVGELPLAKLSDVFGITAEDGSPLPPEAIPLGIALRKQRPAHLRVKFKALDGIERHIEVTAFPLGGRGDRHLGAVAIFWEIDKP